MPAAAFLAVCMWRLAAQTLENPQPLPLGQTLTNLSDAADVARYFLFRVPNHAQTLTISFTPGTGDTDLYLGRLSVPDWEYSSFAMGNTFTLANPAPEDWLVGISSYGRPYSNATLRASIGSLNIGSLRADAGQTELAFTSIVPTRLYTLQRAVDLGTNTTWVTVAQAIGVAVAGSLIDPNPPPVRAFYRVLDEPEPPGGFDGDGDGVRDYLEVTIHHTNPRLADTDGDGWPDGAELDAATDPLNPASAPRLTVMASGGVTLTLLRDYLTIAPSTVLLTRSSTNGVGGQ